jgi:hypothetical protein
VLVHVVLDIGPLDLYCGLVQAENGRVGGRWVENQMGDCRQPQGNGDGRMTVKGSSRGGLDWTLSRPL